MSTLVRHAEPTDYGRVIDVIDAWWGGRQIAAMLPKLFFVHFRDTSFVAEDDHELAGFLCGFRSQTHDDEAYIHFVGVRPDRRGSGLARELYERFFAVARAHDAASYAASPPRRTKARSRSIARSDSTWSAVTSTCSSRRGSDPPPGSVDSVRRWHFRCSSATRTRSSRVPA